MNNYLDSGYEDSDEINIKNIIVLAVAAFSIIAAPVLFCMLSVMAVFMFLSFLF